MTRAGWLAGAAALLGCSDDPAPCTDLAGACIALELRAAAGAGERLDLLEIDLLYGSVHATTSTQAANGRTTSLPIATAVAFPALTAPTAIGIVVVGKLAGAVQSSGSATAMLAADEQLALVIDLGAPHSCTLGLYCGGDKVPGDPDTLYECNTGGVPHARGRCAGGCVVDPGEDDYCRGTGGPCTETGTYCGGNELDGDPQTLYTCTNGRASAPRACNNGCEIRPGLDDRCRP